MNRLTIIVLTSLMLILVACDYEPIGENVLDINPPEENISVEISLNDFTPLDTIYIYKYTRFSLKLSSTKLLRSLSVLLDDMPVSDGYDFGINPNELSEGLHKIRIKSTFTSGTGSLAEILGMEGYEGEISWNILVKHNPEQEIIVKYQINPDGFTEIFWNNPFPSHLTEKFILHLKSPQYKSISFNDINHKSYVDSGYVCDWASYELSIYLKDGSVFRKDLSFSKPIPKLYSEDLGPDKLRIYWDKPFANARYNIFMESLQIESGTTDTSIVVNQIFGKSRQFRLEIEPGAKIFKNSYNTFNVYNWHYQGISLGIPNWSVYAYNKKDNIILGQKYDGLVAFDGNTLQEKNTVWITGNPWGFAYGGKIASAPHNSTVAAMTGEETLIFADNRFDNPIKILSLKGDFNTKLSALTSNDRFFVVENGSKICKIYNSLNGQFLDSISFNFKTTYTFPGFISVTDDGKYFCASSESGIEVFEIVGTKARLVYTDTRLYKGAMFVPGQSDKLLVRVDSKIEIRQIPNFNLVQSLDVSEYGAVLCNIDPASQNLLYFQNDTLKVCNTNNLSVTICKLRSDERTSFIYNNKILTFGRGGMCFDINPYINN